MLQNQRMMIESQSTNDSNSTSGDFSSGHLGFQNIYFKRDEPFCCPSLSGKGDRFIPIRINRDAAISSFELQEEFPNHQRLMHFSFEGKYSSQIASEAMITEAIGKINTERPKALGKRPIPSPFMCLDAPNIQKNFYFNPIDWGSENTIAICLGSSVFFRNQSNGMTEELDMAFFESASPISVKWFGWLLAVGFDNGDMGLWDCSCGKLLRKLTKHSGRVSALNWHPTEQGILSSSSKDTSIFHHDTRVQNDLFLSHNTHSQEIPGLKWSPCGTWLASGGNDNMVCLWSLKSDVPIAKINSHKGW